MRIFIHTFLRLSKYRKGKLCVCVCRHRQLNLHKERDRDTQYWSTEHNHVKKQQLFLDRLNKSEIKIETVDFHQYLRRTSFHMAPASFL
jgi:hypothetical protein